MSEGIEFRVNVDRDKDGKVIECQVFEEGRQCARFFGEPNAQAWRNHLAAEHRGGRVAQATCSKGEACDFDRIHVPLREFNMGAFAVICVAHKAAISAAKPKPTAHA